MDIKEEDPFSDNILSQNETMKRNSDVAIKTEIKSEVLFPSPCSQNEQECFANPLETVTCNNNWKTETEAEQQTLVSDFGSHERDFLLENSVIKVEKFNSDNEIEVKVEPLWIKTETSSVCDDIKDVNFPPVTSSRLCREADFGDCSGKAPLPSTEVSGRDTSFCNVMYHSECENKDSDVTEIVTVKEDIHSEQSAKCSDALYFKQKNSSVKSERPQQCNISESLTDMSHLKSNNLSREGKKPYQCKTCDKSFTWLTNLKRHNIIHEGKKPYWCETCDKGFTQLTSLKRHNFIHEGKKPYQCKTCNKSFTRLSHLKRHNLMHDGKKPYWCETCDKGFTQLTSLKSHNFIHEGKKPHQCKTCNKNFTRLSHLKRHILTHEGKKLHKCKSCDKSFTQLSHLKRHNLTHEDKKPHQCKSCDKSFSQLSNLKRHILTHESRE